MDGSEAARRGPGAQRVLGEHLGTDGRTGQVEARLSSGVLPTLAAQAEVRPDCSHAAVTSFFKTNFVLLLTHFHQVVCTFINSCKH